jgi:hypothetical protein
MSEADLYQLGLAFRQVVLENKLSPDRYPSILLDLGGMPENLQPALSELSRRKIFKDLPLMGSTAENILARDGLAGDVTALYRNEVAAKLIDLVEGILGFVGAPEDCLDDDDADEQDEPMFPPDFSHERHDNYVPYPGEIADYSSSPSRVSGDSLRSSQFFEPEALAAHESTTTDRIKGNNLTLLGQIGRTLLYQLPPFSVFLVTKILLAAQADHAGFEGLLNPSSLFYEYINTMPWLAVSFSSVAFWAGLFQARQTHRASFGLELCVGAYYIMTWGIATPSLLATVEGSYVGIVYLGAVIIYSVNILAARVLMFLFSRRLRS